ncbi:MAG TPA: oligosaccharide flippase family protein [Gemmatales bacterium]|nr:oligosaccharide flippase family protein [Gemmatales bacterium]
MSEEASNSQTGVRSFLLKGGSLIALATFLERGFVFLANVLSVRFGGVENYGAYGLALQAAGFMAGQASLGIGMVAWRFAAEYPVGHEFHRDYVHRIVYLSVGLALISALLMLIFAWPMANWFYDKPQFYPILLVTVYSAPAFVMLDAMRGLMIGMSYYRGQVLLSSIFGITMLLLIPGASMQGARWMVITHAICALIACLSLLIILNRKYHLKLMSPNINKVPIWPMLRFGMVQLGSGLLVSMVMMVVTAMLVRHGSTENTMALALVPLGFLLAQGTVWMVSIGVSHYPLFGFREVAYYNAASAIRSMVSIVPTMLSQTMMSLMTNKRGEAFGGADRMVLINTWISAMFLLPVTTIGQILMFWLLPFLYGPELEGGVLPACLLLAVASIHMVSLPACNRLNVVSPRSIVLANILWAVVVLCTAFFLTPRLGATGVCLALLIAHTNSTIACVFLLNRFGELPVNLLFITILSILGAVVPLVFLDAHRNTLQTGTNGIILLITLTITVLLWLIRGQLRSK